MICLKSIDKFDNCQNFVFKLHILVQKQFNGNCTSYKLVEQSEKNQFKLILLFVAYLLLKSCQRNKFVASFLKKMMSANLIFF